jgi:hypothetical protein
MERQEKKEINRTPENEIRVTPGTNIERAVSRVEEALKTNDKILFSAINAGIPNLVFIVEICKVKIGGLHQSNIIETLKSSTKDQDGKSIEGKERTSTRFRIELTKTKQTLEKGAFYQAPYSEETIKEIVSVQSEPRENNYRGGYRGRGRGGRGRGFGLERGRGGFRGGERGGFRGGERGGFRGGERGGFRGGEGRGRGGFRGDRGNGESRGRGGFRGERGGYGERREFNGDRGRGDFNRGRGGFSRGRGSEERGGYGGDRGVQVSRGPVRGFGGERRGN